MTPQQQLVNVGGVLVERDVLGIVERIYNYDPNLKVQFLNDAARSVSEPPYMIVEVCADGVERPVFSAWKLDESVFQKLFLADTQRWNVGERAELNNSRVREGNTRRFKDLQDEAREIVTSVLKSPKDAYTVPSTVVHGEHGDETKKVTFRA